MIPPIDRDDIHVISRNSNWTSKSIEKMLEEKIYNNTDAWKKFLKTFFISLGVCLTTSGIIFFFAYNWDDLHKFVKIGMIEGLIIATTLLTLFLKINLNLRNIILTGAAMLVGVLFAVFGQVYQTGANAYDFFLAWTCCIALWVIVSNFAPLWLIFIALVDTTFILYIVQVANEWPSITIFNTLFVFNAVLLSIPMIISRFSGEVKVPVWFRNIAGLSASYYATVAVSIGIVNFPRQGSLFGLVCLLSVMAGTAAVFYSIKAKSGFFIALVLFSVVVTISTLLLNASQSSAMFLFTSMFIIGTVTGIIALLIHLQKKWSNE